MSKVLTNKTIKQKMAKIREKSGEIVTYFFTKGQTLVTDGEIIEIEDGIKMKTVTKRKSKKIETEDIEAQKDKNENGDKEQ